MTLSRNTVFFLFFAAAVVARVIFFFLTNFAADDALITFRYAENLITGNGFVYNAGEKVLGTTTPLFTFITSILMLLKFSALKAAMLVSLICSGLTAIIIYRLAQRLRFTKLSFVPALVYILWPRSIVADTSGMETALFTLLIIAAWYFQHRKLSYYSVGLATLASLCRPEGFLLLGIVLIYNCLKDRRYILAYLAVPALIIIPWLVFSYLYFGTIVPTSISGKLALYSHMAIPSFWEKLAYLMGWHNPLGWIMTALAFIGGWWLYQKQNFGVLEIIWLAAMIAFFTIGRTALFFWYVVPVYPIYIIFASASLPFLWDKISIPSSRQLAANMVLTVIICGTLLFMCRQQAIYYKDYARYLNEVHQAIGLYLRDNAAPNDVVAARYIGNTGYYSGLTILDRDGMVTPAAAQYNRQGNYLGLVLDFRPGWVVAAPNREGDEFVDSSQFLEKYKFVKSFGWDASVRHNLYQRKD